MRNGMIILMLLIKATLFNKLITRRCIFQLTKSERKDVRENIDSDDKNFSSVGLAE